MSIQNISSINNLKKKISLKQDKVTKIKGYWMLENEGKKKKKHK